RPGRRVPQSKPVVPRGRPIGSALRTWVSRVFQRVQLTVTALCSKIVTNNGTSGGQPSVASSAAGRVVPERRYMAGDRRDFLQMVVAGSSLDPTTKLPIVMLKAPDNKLNLPIWVGPLEATSMATELEGVKPQRPMTHDLLRNVLSEFGTTVECIEVTDLRENTYFAQIQLKTREGRAIT